MTTKKCRDVKGIGRGVKNSLKNECMIYTFSLGFLWSFFVIKAKHGRLFEINRLSLFKLAGFEIYFLSEDISGAMSKSSRRHQIISRDSGLLDWRKMVRTQKPPRERDLHYKSTWLNQTCSSHVWCPHSFICLNFLKTYLWNWMTFYQVIYWRDFFHCGIKRCDEHLGTKKNLDHTQLWEHLSLKSFWTSLKKSCFGSSLQNSNFH